MFLLYYFLSIYFYFIYLKYIHVPTIKQFLFYSVVRPPLRMRPHFQLLKQAYLGPLDQNIFLLNWFLKFKQLSKINVGFILVLRIKTVKNQTSILSLIQSWLVLLLWLLTSFQWFLVPVLLHYSNQCSGSEVSISFLNFIPQGAGSCVWFHCQDLVTFTASLSW